MTGSLLRAAEMGEGTEKNRTVDRPVVCPGLAFVSWPYQAARAFHH